MKLNELIRADDIRNQLGDLSLAISNPKLPVSSAKASDVLAPLTHRFSLCWKEFEGMSPERFWASYLFVMVRRVGFQVRNLSERLERKLEFRAFPIPDDTDNRYSVTFNEGGFFLHILGERFNAVIGDMEKDVQRTHEMAVLTLTSKLLVKENEIIFLNG